MEIAQRVGGQQLPVNTDPVHRRDPQVRVHEGAATIADPAQLVVAYPEHRRAVGLVVKLRAVRSGAAKGLLDHGVGVNVDYARIGEAHQAYPLTMPPSTATEVPVM